MNALYLNFKGNKGLQLIIMRSVFLLSLFMGSSNSFSQIAVDAVLESYKKDKDLKHASYSFCVLDAQTGKTLKEFNSETALVPASTMKIITTGAALGILGKNFVYKTHFYEVQNDSPAGIPATHLLIKGSGDPTFGSSYFFENDSAFLNEIVRKLKTKGLKKITGSLVADASSFDNTIPSTWIWGDIGNYFGAGANSLSYHDNKFSLFYTSGPLNTRAKLEAIIPDYFSEKMEITSNVISSGSEDNAFVFGEPNGYIREVKGSIPPNKTRFEVEAEMPHPPLFFLHQLKQDLKRAKLCDDKTGLINMSTNTYSYTNEKLIYTHVSPKLDQVVYYTNIKSNNHYAESLLKTVGAFTTGKQGTTENGIQAVESFWKSRGVDISGLHMVDGSGLSRANTITTKIQATVLSKIYRDSLMYPSFNGCLPVAGKNGSMTSLCRGTFAENNLRAKTGYINRARGYCGYVKTKSGKELAFSVLFNNYDCSAKEMKLKIEKFLVALVEL
jgi:D-alanyl-D-alanine carboxypeptidase/D-alanyl-D-alanine-endopeptidase (penicillin-binding protein 4)